MFITIAICYYIYFFIQRFDIVALFHLLIYKLIIIIIIITGQLTSAEGYKPAIFVFAGCAGVSAILAFILIFVDLKEGGILNASASVRKAYLAEQRKKEEEAQAAAEAAAKLEKGESSFYKPAPVDGLPTQDGYVAAE
jgi:amino acid permease